MPFSHSGFFIYSFTKSNTSSSVTRSPRYIVSFTYLPSSVFFETASLNKSPVDTWQIHKSSLIAGAYVPLPEPGGPTKITFMSGLVMQAARRFNSANKSSSFIPLKFYAITNKFFLLKF